MKRHFTLFYSSLFVGVCFAVSFSVSSSSIDTGENTVTITARLQAAAKCLMTSNGSVIPIAILAVKLLFVSGIEYGYDAVGMNPSCSEIAWSPLLELPAITTSRIEPPITRISNINAYKIKHVLPHEMGHVFSLFHAPYGPTAGPDPWFARNAKNGQTLSTGWDFVADKALSGDTKDMMSYCAPYWVGAHDLSRMIAALENLHDLPGNPPQAFLRESVSFDTSDGYMRIFGSSTPGYDDPTEAGPVLFEGLDAKGNVLFAVHAALDVIEAPVLHPTQGGAGMSIPYDQTMIDRLEAVRVTYGGLVGIQHSLPRGTVAARVVAVDSQHVKVTFDGRHFRQLLAFDGATGRWITNLPGSFPAETYTVDTASPNVFLSFDDSIKTIAYKVKVSVEGRAGNPVSQGTFYHDYDYGGSSINVTTDIPDLAVLHDSKVISSSRIAYGIWQVCTAPNYAGTCVDLHAGDYPNFGKLGINDRVQSIRIL